MADRKSRQMLHKAKKNESACDRGGSRMYVQAAGTELEEDSAIDIIIGNNRKKDLVSILEHYERSAVQEISDRYQSHKRVRETVSGKKRWNTPEPT